MNDDGLPIEHFIQALTSQLDRAQTALALKARKLPLTFAVKDLKFDLRTQVEMRNSAVYIRPAAANEADASTIQFTLTSITRPMIEENTAKVDPEETSLQEVLGDEISEDEQRRLEWAGIRNAGDLRELHRQGGENAIRHVTQLPVQRLRTALRRATQPRVVGITPEPQTPKDPHVPPDLPVPIRPTPDTKPPLHIRPVDVLRPRIDAGPVPVDPLPPPASPPVASVKDQPLLRIHGENLLTGGGPPTVRMDGQPIPVLRASDRELLVAPNALSGTLAIEVEPGNVVEADFDATDLAFGMPTGNRSDIPPLAPHEELDEIDANTDNGQPPDVDGPAEGDVE